VDALLFLCDCFEKWFVSAFFFELSMVRNRVLPVSVLSKILKFRFFVAFPRPVFVMDRRDH